MGPIIDPGEDRGIPELSIPKVDLALLPKGVTDEQILLSLLEKADRIIGIIVRSYLPRIRDSQAALAVLEYIAVTTQTNWVPDEDAGSTQRNEKLTQIRAVAESFSVEDREYLATVHSVIEAAYQVRLAIRNQDVFAAARWAHSHGDSMVRLHMRAYQPSAKTGAAIRAAARLGAEAKVNSADEWAQQVAMYIDAIKSVWAKHPRVTWERARELAAADLGKGHSAENIRKVLRDHGGITKKNFPK